MTSDGQQQKYYTILYMTKDNSLKAEKVSQVVAIRYINEGKKIHDDGWW